MSVSLQEVIEAGGYDLNTPEDSRWLLSVRNEFEALVEKADFIVDQEIERGMEAEEVAYEMRREDE
jgi:hypothetical protein